MNTSFTESAFTLPFSKAPFIAVDPRTVAGTVDNPPINAPIGVLTAETIYTVLLIILLKFSTKIRKREGKSNVISLSIVGFNMLEKS